MRREESRDQPGNLQLSQDLIAFCFVLFHVQLK